MSERKIVKAWEMLSRDDVAHFEIGDSPGFCSGWTVGKIELVYDNTIFGIGARLFIYDTDGNAKVSYPPNMMAWEFAEER